MRKPCPLAWLEVGTLCIASVLDLMLERAQPSEHICWGLPIANFGLRRALGTLCIHVAGLCWRVWCSSLSNVGAHTSTYVGHLNRAKWLMVKKNHTQYIILGMEKRTTIGLTHIWDSALFPLQNTTGKANICASFSPGPRPVSFIGKIFPDVKNSLPQGTASDSPWREIFTISPKFGVQIRESLQYRWS